MGKTITTYLVNGDPMGTRYYFISNKLCQMFVVPRSELSYLSKQEKLQKPAFYILLGEDDESSPKAYIGETESFRERVKSHDSNKQFWQKALVFVSSDSTITKADVQYLEYKAIAKAKEADTYLLDENKQIPKKPNLPEYQQDVMDEFFEDIKLLVSFIGCNIFDVVQSQHFDLFYIKSKNCDAKGVYNTSGFTVLKGSVLSGTCTSSFTNKEKRGKFLSDNAKLENGLYVLKSDKTFPSPSTASSYCLGRSSNGWTEWKNEDGKNLASIYKVED